MNTDKTFEFYLKKDDSTYFAVKDNVVIETATKTPLRYSPADWADALVASKISGQEWIATREYTEPLKFVLDGAKIIRHIMYTQGFTGNCIFLIEKLNTYNRKYFKWYEGDIDISNCNDEDDFVTANVLETDLMGLIRNREDIPYEIDLSSGLLLYLDGVKLGARAKWIIGDSGSGATADFPAISHGNSNWGVMGANDTNITNGGSGYFFVTTPFGDNVQAGNFISPNNNSTWGWRTNNALSSYPATIQGRYFTLARAAAKWYNIRVSGNLSLGVHIEANGLNSGTAIFKVSIYLGIGPMGGAQQSTLLLGSYDNIPNNTWTYPNIPLGGNISEIESDQDIFLYMIVEIGTGGSHDFFSVSFQSQDFIDGSSLQIDYQAKVQNTTTRVFRYIDFFKALISKMTDGQYTCKSDFLSNIDTSASTRFANFDNSPYNTIVTSGSGLRSLDDAKIKTTFQDAIKDIWGRWCLAWAIEGDVVRIEPLSYFYGNNELYHFDRLSNVIVSFWRDRLFNQLNAGYKSYDNDTVDGLNEFNTGISFMAQANTILKSTDDMVCPYRSDVYGIESIRAQTVDDDTKDNDFDNDIFVIEIDPDVVIQPPFEDHYIVYRPTPISISGVDDPENIYNLALSPKRALFRHLRRIRSLIDIGQLTYQTIDKNPSLACNLGAGNVVETDNIDLSQLSLIGHSFPLLFEPVIIEFDAPSPYNLMEMLDANQAGYISFTYNDTVFKGFILDVGCKPAIRDKYTFRLLSHPDNDLTKLR